MNESQPTVTSGLQVVTVDTLIYPLPALLKTAYWFTGRCFVHLEFGSNEQTVLVRLKPKPNLPIQELTGEFTNRLLDQTLREKLGKETETLRNLIIAHALSDTCLINPELETADPFSDPSNITRPDETAQT